MATISTKKHQQWGGKGCQSVDATFLIPLELLHLQTRAAIFRRVPAGAERKTHVNKQRWQQTNREGNKQRKNRTTMWKNWDGLGREKEHYQFGKVREWAEKWLLHQVIEQMLEWRVTVFDTLNNCVEELKVCLHPARICWSVYFWA